MLDGTKRRWSTLLAVMLVWTMFSGLGTAVHASADDLDGHWAEESMRAWVESGLLKGYEDGTYRPNQVVTRVELVTLINRAFELTEDTKSQFTDVGSSGGWIYKQVGIAVEAGYIKGYDDGYFRPERHVTREEASYMLTSLLQLDAASLNVLDGFQDVSELTDAGKQAIANMVDKGILKGLSDGILAPQQGLTRAQAVTVLSTTLEIANPTTVYDQEGVYGPESGQDVLKGDVVISAAGVTLRNIKITGDLTVTSEVGEGDVFFKGVTVEGETSIQGGGPNSIHFEDSVLVRISIDKKDGSVRVVVVGESSIQHVLVNSPVKLEESDLTDSGFANVELSDALPTESQVELVGQFESIDVFASDIKVSVPSGSIKELNVQENAANNLINLNKEATVLKLVLDSVAELLGQGKVQQATVNKGAEGSNFETKPNAIEGEGASAATPAPTPGVINPGPISTPEPEPTATPQPSATPPSPCTEASCATLVDLKVGDFTMNRLTGDYTNTGETGFDPHTLGYSIVTDRNMTSVPVSVTVTQSAYTKATYSVWTGNYEDNIGGNVGSEPFEINIHPMKDTRISIQVSNDSKSDVKRYDIYIQYPRTVQEGFKLLRHFNVSNGGKYNYTLASGTLNGERLLASDTIEVYESSSEEEPFQACGYRTCYIPDGKIIGDSGSLFIKVYREQTLLIEGTYQYDLTPIQKIESTDIFTVERLNKQELINEFVNNHSSTPYSHAIKSYIDPVKLKEVLPNVKYVGDGLEFINVERSEYPSALQTDIAKTGISPAGYPGYTFSHANRLDEERTDPMRLGGAFFLQSDDENASKEVEDLFVYFIYYDSDLNPLGYSVQAVTFDEQHVADGYIPSNNWKPTP